MIKYRGPGGGGGGGASDVTLQRAYDNGAAGITNTIRLDATKGPVLVRDTAGADGTSTLYPGVVSLGHNFDGRIEDGDQAGLYSVRSIVLRTFQGPGPEGGGFYPEAYAAQNFITDPPPVAFSGTPSRTYSVSYREDAATLASGAATDYTYGAPGPKREIVRYSAYASAVERGAVRFLAGGHTAAGAQGLFYDGRTQVGYGPVLDTLVASTLAEPAQYSPILAWGARGRNTTGGTDEAVYVGAQLAPVSQAGRVGGALRFLAKAGAGVDLGGTFAGLGGLLADFPLPPQAGNTVHDALILYNHAWNAAGGVEGAASGGTAILYSGRDGAFNEEQLGRTGFLIADATNGSEDTTFFLDTRRAGGGLARTLTFSPANGMELLINGGSNPGLAPSLGIWDTTGTGGAVVTRTSSNVGGAGFFAYNDNGTNVVGALNCYGTSNGATVLGVAAAGLVALRGVNAPVAIGPTSSAALTLGSNNTGRWQVNAAGHLIAFVDATYDIGGSGANRPRNIFASASIAAGSIVINGATATVETAKVARSASFGNGSVELKGNRAAADAGADLEFNTAVLRNAETPLAAFQNNGVDRLRVLSGATAGAILESFEVSAAPAAGAANSWRLYGIDNGSGKTQVFIQFATGAPVLIATQP